MSSVERSEFLKRSLRVDIEENNYDNMYRRWNEERAAKKRIESEAKGQNILAEDKKVKCIKNVPKKTLKKNNTSIQIVNSKNDIFNEKFQRVKYENPTLEIENQILKKRVSNLENDNQLIRKKIDEDKLNKQKMTQEINSLKIQIQQCNKQNTVCVEDLKKAKKVTEFHEANLRVQIDIKNQCQDKIKKIEKDFRALEEKNTKMFFENQKILMNETNLKAATTRVQELLENCQISNTKIDYLEKQLKENKKETKSYKRQALILERNRINLEKKLEASQKKEVIRIFVGGTHMNELETMIKELDEENKKLKELLDVDIIDKSSVHGYMDDTYQEQRTREMQICNKMLERKIFKLESDLKKSIKEVSRLNEALRVGKNEVIKTKDKCQKTEKKIENMTNKHAHDILIQNNLQHKNEGLQSQINDLRKQIMDYRLQIKAVHEIYKTNDEKDLEIKKLDIEAEKYHSLYLEAVDEAKSTRIRQQELKGMLKMYSTNVKDLGNKFAEEEKIQKQKIKNYEEDKNRSKMEFDKIENENKIIKEKANKENLDWQSRVKELKQNEEKLETENKILRVENERMKSSNNEKELEKLKNERDITLTRNKDLEKQLLRIKEENLKLSFDIDFWKHENIAKKYTLSDCKDEKIYLESIEHYKRKNIELTTKNQESQRKIQELELKIKKRIVVENRIPAVSKPSIRPGFKYDPMGLRRRKSKK